MTPAGDLARPGVSVVTPNPKTAGYSAPANAVPLTHSAPYGTGSAAYQVLDPTRVTAHRYRVEFVDTQTDGIDNNGNEWRNRQPYNGTFPPPKDGKGRPLGHPGRYVNGVFMGHVV